MLPDFMRLGHLEPIEMGQYKTTYPKWTWFNYFGLSSSDSVKDNSMI